MSFLPTLSLPQREHHLMVLTALVYQNFWSKIELGIVHGHWKQKISINIP